MTVVLALGLVPCAHAAGTSDRMKEGIALYRAGAVVRARDAFEQAAFLAPQEALPALWLGAVAMAQEDRRNAAVWFAEALRRHPTLVERNCAAAWLSLLGISVDRPRRHVQTPEDYSAFVRASNPSLTSGQARWLAHAVVTVAARYRLDARLLVSVIYIESRFNHQSISPAGAEGLGQLMPRTAAGLGVDPRDPLQNLLGSAWLLRLNLDEFRNLPLALAAYNAGSGAVRQWAGIPPYAETHLYVWAVLRVYDSLRT
jgi:soluble lytic murein transglycosylase-like protein